MNKKFCIQAKKTKKKLKNIPALVKEHEYKEFFRDFAPDWFIRELILEVNKKEKRC